MPARSPARPPTDILILITRFHLVKTWFNQESTNEFSLTLKRVDFSWPMGTLTFWALFLAPQDT